MMCYPLELRGLKVWVDERDRSELRLNQEGISPTTMPSKWWTAHLKDARCSSEFRVARTPNSRAASGRHRAWSTQYCRRVMTKLPCQGPSVAA